LATKSRGHGTRFPIDCDVARELFIHGSYETASTPSCFLGEVSLVLCYRLNPASTFAGGRNDRGIALFDGADVKSVSQMIFTHGWDFTSVFPRYLSRTPRKYTSRVVIRAFLALFIFSTFAAAQEHVSFSTQDGGVVFADLYGQGERSVVLAHGGQFNKESWKPQAEVLAASGFRVLALDFRGYGQSRGPGDSDPMDAPLYFDVLAAVRYLRNAGAQTVSVVGASMGGWAGAGAVVAGNPGEIDRLVELGAAGGKLEKVKCPKLLIVARDDASGSGLRLPQIRAEYGKAPKPKKLIVLKGSAHAQFLFQTGQGERVMREILRFLNRP
jgi:pimeloyl-ACP methyl ester carboxylesterase